MELDALRQRRQLVMSGALFYEILDTSVQQRRRCFNKLPPVENPVILVDHIGELLRHELREQRSCGRPSDHAIKIRFRFNPSLLLESYEMPPEASEAMQEEVDSLAEGKQRLIGLSETASSLFEDLLSGSDFARRQAADLAFAQIADPKWVTGFYEQLSSPNPDEPFPDASIVDLSWAHLRWLQVQLLFSVNLYIRYQGRLGGAITSGVHERLEHDLHDAQALVLGVLEGALATREKKLANWFKLLCPNGELFY